MGYRRNTLRVRTGLVWAISHIRKPHYSVCEGVPAAHATEPIVTQCPRPLQSSSEPFRELVSQSRDEIQQFNIRDNDRCEPVSPPAECGPVWELVPVTNG